MVNIQTPHQDLLCRKYQEQRVAPRPGTNISENISADPANICPAEGFEPTLMLVILKSLYYYVQITQK